MKILIYGLGKEALLAKKSLRKEHTVIGFTDSFAKLKNYAGIPFYDRKSLDKVNFDYIVLALSNRKVSESVKSELRRGGVEEGKIVDFLRLFTRQKIDKIMKKSENEKIDGLILGISHALYGINPSYLSGVWKNLAMQGEDLYYHYKVLKKCADCYSNMISNLKYVIVDLYDYTIFNFDLSLVNTVLYYWSEGGYVEDLHHFNKNRNYGGNIEQEMEKAGLYLPITSKRDFQFAEQLFDVDIVEHEIEYLYPNRIPGNDGFRDYPLQSQLDKIIPENPVLPYNLYCMKRYPETVEENINVMEELIKLLKQINRNIKIYFVMLPRFGNLEKFHAVIMGKEKEEFENIMSDFLKEDNCYFFNFKQCKEICNNRYFFWDTAHLNYMGAIAFTGLLNNSIKSTL